jgi:hypothetical protein
MFDGIQVNLVRNEARATATNGEQARRRTECGVRMLAEIARETLSAVLARAWPLDRGYSFNALLQRIDDAERGGDCRERKEPP